MNGLVRKLAAKAGIHWALGQVRAAAEGRLGPEWKARYDWWVGKKTITGVALGAIAAALLALGYTDASAGLGIVAGVAIQAGLLDKAWRTELPPAITESRPYTILAANSALLATLLATAFAGLKACGDPSCARWADVVLVLGAVAVQLGLVDAAWQAEAPRRDGEGG